MDSKEVFNSTDYTPFICGEGKVLYLISYI